MSSEAPPSGRLRFIDIGANLTDGVFSGSYNGRDGVHPPDTDVVLQRARDSGVTRVIVTAGTVQQSREALALSMNHNQVLFSTAGIHPTRADEIHENPDAIQQLRELLASERRDESAARDPRGHQRRVVAVGECGLDYDRLQFCGKERQKEAFQMQFALAEEFDLPMFLHNRNTSGDFVQMVQQNRHRFSTGIVHSYTGGAKEASDLLALDLYIGINGCSLKTQENLDVLKTIPLDRLMLETDCPYCEVRKSHAGHSFVRTQWPAKDKKKYLSDHLVKGRSEPCMILQVCEVVANVLGEKEEVVAKAAYDNTMRVFFPEEAAYMGDSPYEMASSAAQQR